MGHIQAFDIKKFIERFEITGYIETGTGIGDSLSHALKFPFKKLYSIEFDKKLYKECIKNFTDPRLTIINNLSKWALPIILKEIDENEKCLFFLDAHFPGADFGTEPDRYQTSLKSHGSNALPLEEELNIIKHFRPQYKDIIIIDDVWIYEKGPFETGNWKERDKLKIGSMKFVYDIFGVQYNIQKSFKQQGYMILTPRL